MMTENRNTLGKEERLCGRNAVEELFGKTGSSSMVAFPLRVVYALTEKTNAQEASVKMLVSVPKKHFKRAVKRNRVKRQVREAYRKNKHDLIEAVESCCGKSMSLAFIWLDDNLHSSKTVEKKVTRLLLRIKERLEKDKVAQSGEVQSGTDE